MILAKIPHWLYEVGDEAIINEEKREEWETQRTPSLQDSQEMKIWQTIQPYPISSDCHVLRLASKEKS